MSAQSSLQAPILEGTEASPTTLTPSEPPSPLQELSDKDWHDVTFYFDRPRWLIPVSAIQELTGRRRLGIPAPWEHDGVTWQDDFEDDTYVFRSPRSYLSELSQLALAELDREDHQPSYTPIVFLRERAQRRLDGISLRSLRTELAEYRSKWFAYLRWGEEGLTCPIFEETFPKKTVDESMLDLDGRAVCPICRMGELGEEFVTLPCNHWFHDECILAWIRQHTDCPYCRQNAPPWREA